MTANKKRYVLVDEFYDSILLQERVMVEDRQTKDLIVMSPEKYEFISEEILENN